MELIEEIFYERIKEIDVYLDFLSAVENEVRNGLPRIGASIISTTQRRILYSSVYLQLYNLVEATITKCVEAITVAVTKEEKWRPHELSPEIRREWVRHLARTHVDLNYENRLLNSLAMCEHLIADQPVKGLDIDKGGGGNWNDEEIHRMAVRLGCRLHLSEDCIRDIKRPFKQDKGALALIVKLRNDLAHGSVSFGECGDGTTVEELRELADRTGQYLSEVVGSFKTYIENRRFLAVA